jgi:hypothetical protein
MDPGAGSKHLDVATDQSPKSFILPIFMNAGIFGHKHRRLAAWTRVGAAVRWATDEQGERRDLQVADQTALL